MTKDKYKIYTIQNEKGERGWIQYIDPNCVGHDEINGCQIDVDVTDEKYLVISKEEYDIIKNLHDLFNETGLQEYFDMINTMADLTIEKNKTRLF